MQSFPLVQLRPVLSTRPQTIRGRQAPRPFASLLMARPGFLAAAAASALAPPPGRGAVRSHALDAAALLSSSSDGEDSCCSDSEFDAEIDVAPFSGHDQDGGGNPDQSKGADASASAGGGGGGAAAGGRAVCESRDVKARLSGSATAQVDLEARYRMSPQLLFDLLADPTQHARIFEAIESADASLLSEEGPVKRYRLDYVAKWKFWRVSGTCVNKLVMTTDSEAGTVSFKLREPGFLRNYEGCWSITGPSGVLRAPAAAPATPAAAPAVTSLSLGGAAASPAGVVATIAKMLEQQEASNAAAAAALARRAARRGGRNGGGAPAAPQYAVVRATCFTTPSRTPPPPINQALKAQAKAQIEEQLEGLVAAAQRAAAAQELAPRSAR